MSIAACMLASEAQLPSVSPSSRRSRTESSSKSRVMLSSISTKPLIELSPSSPLRTGVICARSSWPARVVVTNCADGLATPRCMRWPMFSSAWATSLRSNTV